MNTFAFPTGGCVLMLVIAAAAFDMHARRIPNWLVAIGLIAALPVNLFVHGFTFEFLQGPAGFATGIAVFLPFYLLRAFGAGDVKLMGAIGALVGPEQAFQIALTTFVVGGVIALAVIAWRRQFRAAGNSMFLLLSGNVRPTQQTVAGSAALGTMPYAVTMAIGTVVAILIS